MFCFIYIIVISMVLINECIDVNTALKNSFKSMSCSHRIHQFQQKFPSLASPRLYLDIFFQIYARPLSNIYRQGKHSTFRAQPFKVLHSDTLDGGKCATVTNTLAYGNTLGTIKLLQCKLASCIMKVLRL